MHEKRSVIARKAICNTASASTTVVRMKKLLPVAMLIQLAFAHGADDAAAKPGFWERAWRSSKNGAGWLWGSTKRAGEKTVSAAKSPFRKGKPNNPDPKAGWNDLAMTMTLEPSVVKLPDTRVIEVTVAVVNKGRQAVELEFPSSQRIEVLVKSEARKVLQRWSDDQRLDKEQGFILINPGERIEYGARVSTRDMVAGQSYQIEAFFPSFERLRASRSILPVRGN
jgi:hypothetical protein